MIALRFLLLLAAAVVRADDCKDDPSWRAINHSLMRREFANTLRADTNFVHGNAKGRFMEPDRRDCSWVGSRDPKHLCGEVSAEGVRAAEACPEACKNCAFRERTFAEYLAECQRNASEIKITSWMGRMGNHLHQLANAIGYARASGRRVVRTPGYVDHVFLVPEALAVAAGGHVSRCEPFEVDVLRSGPRQSLDCDRAFYQRCPTTILERREIYRTHIKPLLFSSLVGPACEAPPEDELVMHLRDGDVAGDTAGTHAQPPCAYFLRVIETGNHGGRFSAVHLVHKGAKKPSRLSPCLAEIKARAAPRTRVIESNATTLEDDVCLILKATNLALTVSSFGVTLAMMSASVKQLFQFHGGLREMGSYVDLGAPPATAPGLPVPVLVAHEARRRFTHMILNFTELCDAFPRVVYYTLADGAAGYALPGSDVPLVERACGE